MKKSNKTYYAYDIMGNVKSLLQDYGAGSAMGLTGNRYKRIDYAFDLISGKVNAVHYQKGAADAFSHYYRYDAENRLTDVYTSADGANLEHEAYYTYYRHGALGRMVLGNNRVQGVDYAYTLQGWLKGVNGAQDMGNDSYNTNKSIARDAYQFSLNYFGNDYAAIGGQDWFGNMRSVLGAEYRPLYNGNISSMQVGIEKLGNPMLYNYQYDQLNRLTGMNAFKQTTINAWTATNDYKEKISYDPNGNILSYDRNGVGGALDKFTYTYGANNNRLMELKNGVNGGVYNYDYDSIGNTTKDGLQAVNGIVWNVYGKVLNIISKGINYQYDATGNRIYKYAGGITEYYVRDAQGNVMATYSNREGSLKKSEQHLYGSSRLGIVDKPKNLDLVTGIYLFKLGTGYRIEFERGKKQFELTNHLGNVLATVSDKKMPISGDGKTIDYYVADVVTATDYYPFGMQMPSRTFNGSGYKFGFNGQEKSNEIGENLYTAQFWEYDSRIGRRWNVEPLIQKYPSNSSYLVFGNNPITVIDPDGKEGIVISGQAGDHVGREHFLVNGLSRAKAMASEYKKEGKGETATWIIYNSGGKGGYDSKTIEKYQKLAGKAGVNVIVVSDANEIVDYVNNKTGDDSRSKDLISKLSYVGHATPGDLDVGFEDHGNWNMLTNDKVEPSDFSGDAFKSGCAINVVGGCRTAVDGNLPGEKSVIEQLADKVDTKSTIKGSDVRVYYPGGVVNDKELVAPNKGNVVEIKGKKK